MADTTATPPSRVKRLATQPMRSMLVSRSSLEKPRPFDRCVRTTSPSSGSTSRPRRVELEDHDVRDRRLAGAGEAGEPEGEARSGWSSRALLGGAAREGGTAVSPRVIRDNSDAYSTERHPGPAECGTFPAVAIRETRDGTALEARYRARSLWLDGLPEPLAPRPSFAGDAEVDVAIVGAGFTGLWTAYYLAVHAPELRVAVVEREIAGFGASGRNGGWLSAGIAADPRVVRPPPWRAGRARRRARDGRGRRRGRARGGRGGHRLRLPQGRPAHGRDVTGPAGAPARLGGEAPHAGAPGPTT